MSGLLLSVVLPAVARAQAQSTTQPETQQAATSDVAANDIVVTARKRAESVLTVPVSITAYTGNDLETRGVKTMSDLAAFTPGLTAQNAATGGARADRSSQLFYLRGITPSSSIYPTVSVFINGTPIGAADMIQNLDDLDHVEVLKGPQSAYFGRQVFAGAINVVAKPAGDKFEGNLSGEAATRNTYRASGSVTVPVIQGLSFRIGGLFDKRDGSYENAYNPGERLGNQKTYGGHLAVTIKPSDNLTIKAFGTYFENHDGPPATGLILFQGTTFNQSNCTVNNTAYRCGNLPGLTNASPAQHTNFTAAQQAFFGNPGGIIGKSDLVSGYGLARQANHEDVSIDWKVLDTGLTLSYLAGRNRDNYSEISDLSNINGAANGQYPGYAGFTYLVEQREHDYSQEVRLASDPARRLRFLLGGSYLNVYRESINASVLPLAPQGTPTISLTRGAFFSLAYDILPSLTLTAEGRYQWDTQKSLNLAHTALLYRGTSRNFLPRVTLEYKPMPGAMVYATYSQGVNPGVYNGQYSTFPAASLAKLATVGASNTQLGAPEKLYNYEIGAKGRFFDGRLTLQLAAYYDKWKNQIQANSYVFTATDPANPFNIPGYSQYNAALVNTRPLTYQYTAFASSTAKGLEGEAVIIPVKNVTVNFVGAINDTKYDKFFCAGGTLCPTYPYTSGSATATGFQADGKRLPYAPEYSATIGAQYGHSTSLFGATDFFARVDYIYRSSIFLDSTNIAKIPNSNTVNLRAGINFVHFEVEAFVNNVTNERAYTTGFNSSNFGNFFQPAVMVGLPTLITAGGRVRVRF